VYSATNQEGYSVAIKKMVISFQAKKEVLVNEVQIMKSTAHENIVNFLDCYLWEGSLWVIMELVSGCSLAEILEEHKGLDEPMIKYFGRRITSGVAYLHGKNIIHRDIKSDNILVGGNGDVKISKIFEWITLIFVIS
jgi:serine/threonine protein kinase